MSFSLPPLPYPDDALEPHIGRDTVRIHHRQHQAGYLRRTNELLAAAGKLQRSLEAVMIDAHRCGFQELFDQAAQAWNHAFYWNSLKPRGGGLPHGAVGTLIERDFGDHETFAAALNRAATSHFGSGWVWVVLDQGHVRIIRTANAGNPLVDEYLPLLAIDLWEHAYYLDYHHRRFDYLARVVGYLLNWDFANRNLHQALPRRALLAPGPSVLPPALPVGTRP